MPTLAYENCLKSRRRWAPPSLRFVNDIRLLFVLVYQLKPRSFSGGAFFCGMQTAGHLPLQLATFQSIDTRENVN